MMSNSKRKNVAKIVAAASSSVFLCSPTCQLHGIADDFLVMGNGRDGLKSNVFSCKRLSKFIAPLMDRVITPAVTSLKNKFVQLSNSDLLGLPVRFARRVCDKVFPSFSIPEESLKPKFDKPYLIDVGVGASKWLLEKHMRSIVQLENQLYMYSDLNPEERKELQEEYVIRDDLNLPQPTLRRIIMDALYSRTACDVTPLLKALDPSTKFPFKIEDEKMQDLSFLKGKGEIDDNLFVHAIEAIKKAEKPEGKVAERHVNFLSEVLMHHTTPEQLALGKKIFRYYNIFEGVNDSDRHRIIRIITPRKWWGWEKKTKPLCS